MIIARAVYIFMKGILQMMNYEEIYRTLLELSKNEGLRFIEAELEDNELLCLQFEDKIVLNTKCDKFLKE